jgi:hypothetical protein
MTQYDAGPGDWSDREWETPGRSQKDQAKKRRFTLPPWAMLAALVAAVILLCVGLVLIVRAIRGGRQAQTPTAEAAGTRLITPLPSAREEDLQPTVRSGVLPSPTFDLGPALTPEETEPVFLEIAPGATVRTATTLPLNLRAQARTGSASLAKLDNNTLLLVLEGPEEGEGYTWWKVRTEDGKEGWVANNAAGDWLKLKTD